MTRTSDEIPQSEHNEHRMRRARSWLAQSENVESDEEKFICLWIAFNAAYGGESTGKDEIPETKRFTDFLSEIIKRDEHKEIEKIIWGTFSGPVRILLDNRYVFAPFWEFVREPSMDNNWRKQFESNRDNARKNLGKRNVYGVSSEVFRRLYQLRNQVFHGGVTFEKGWGRTQLRDGNHIMEAIVPIILKIMEDNIDENPNSEVWGKIAYPRVGASRW